MTGDNLQMYAIHSIVEWDIVCCKIEAYFYNNYNLLNNNEYVTVFDNFVNTCLLF